MLNRFQAVSTELLRCGRALPRRVAFLRTVSRALLDAAPGAHALALAVADGSHHYAWRAESTQTPAFALLTGPLPAPPPDVVAVDLPFAIDAIDNGLLRLEYPSDAPPAAADRTLLQSLANTLGVAIANRRSHAALAERVKELTCLYALARVSEDPHLDVDAALDTTVELLPPAWQYPELVSARILLDDRLFSSEPALDDDDAPHALRAPLIIAGLKRGHVEIRYRLPADPQHDLAVLGDDVFLPEERDLLTAVAREVSRDVERRLARADRERLLAQVAHADRLAAVGQLAAGVAHELNEPLGGILGFAELALAAPELPAAPRRDLERIVDTTLYAREIIKQLLLFARQTPTRRAPLDLSRTVDAALTFLAARCAHQGVTLRRDLAPDLPAIVGDTAQLQQVVVNLVVNALLAMPDGGALTVQTARLDADVVLTIADTGPGMPPEVAAQMFVPFFTTRDVGDGTGLGLSVTHGIVTAHGGSIDVDTAPGRGTRLTVRLPASPPPHDAR